MARRQQPGDDPHDRDRSPHQEEEDEELPPGVSRRRRPRRRLSDNRRQDEDLDDLPQLPLRRTPPPDIRRPLMGDDADMYLGEIQLLSSPEYPEQERGGEEDQPEEGAAEEVPEVQAVEVAAGDDAVAPAADGDAEMVRLLRESRDHYRRGYELRGIRIQQLEAMVNELAADRDNAVNRALELERQLQRVLANIPVGVIPVPDQPAAAVVRDQEPVVGIHPPPQDIPQLIPAINQALSPRPVSPQRLHGGLSPEGQRRRSSSAGESERKRRAAAGSPEERPRSAPALLITPLYSPPQPLSPPHPSSPSPSPSPSPRPSPSPSPRSSPSPRPSPSPSPSSSSADSVFLPAQQAVQPVAALQAVQPVAALQAVQPVAVQQAVQPVAAQPVVQPVAAAIQPPLQPPVLPAGPQAPPAAVAPPQQPAWMRVAGGRLRDRPRKDYSDDRYFRDPDRAWAFRQRRRRRR